MSPGTKIEPSVPNGAAESAPNCSAVLQREFATMQSRPHTAGLKYKFITPSRVVKAYLGQARDNASVYLRTEEPRDSGRVIWRTVDLHRLGDFWRRIRTLQDRSY